MYVQFQACMHGWSPLITARCHCSSHHLLPLLRPSHSPRAPSPTTTEAMERYHALPTTRRRIPFTNVRGASNLVHQPLATGARRGQWTNGAVVPGHFELGYK